MKNVLIKYTALSMIVMIIPACGYTERSEQKIGSDNISGTYRFSGLGKLKAGQFPNPLIDLKDIKEPSVVKIRQNNGVFEVKYLSNLGKPITKIVDLNKQKEKGVSWKNRELVTSKKVPVTGPVILPLPAKHYRGTRIFQNADGDLCIIGFFKEKGLYHTDYSEYELILKKKK